MGGGRFAALVQLTGEALFHDLHDDRGIADFGLGDEQVKVLGHEDVSVNHEAVLAAGLFEDFQEEVAAAGGVELGLAAVTTASDEMQVAGAIIADESLGHAGKGKGSESSLDVMGLQGDGDSTHTSQSARCVGHPAITFGLRVADVAPAQVSQQRRDLGHPALSQNPVPFINQPLVPTTTAPGGSGFTLTVSAGCPTHLRSLQMEKTWGPGRSPALGASWARVVVVTPRWRVGRS